MFKLDPDTKLGIKPGQKSVTGHSHVSRAVQVGKTTVSGSLTVHFPASTVFTDAIEAAEERELLAWPERVKAVVREWTNETLVDWVRGLRVTAGQRDPEFTQSVHKEIKRRLELGTIEEAAGWR